MITTNQFLVTVATGKFLWEPLLYKHRSQWPRGLRRRSAAACLLRSWVWIQLGAWIFVCCECCVLSGRGLCDELITRPEESYRLGCIVVCDLETSRMRRPWLALGRSTTEKKNFINSLVAALALHVIHSLLYCKPQFLRNHPFCPVTSAETDGQS